MRLDSGGVVVCVVGVEGGWLEEVGEDALEELLGEVGELEGHLWWCLCELVVDVG